MKLSPRRQSLRLCRRVHRQHEFSDRHCAVLCGRLHLHHLPAAHAAGRSPGVCADSEERRGAGASPSAPAQRQAHEADAHGRRPPGRPLPQSHHPCPGNDLSGTGLAGGCAPHVTWDVLVHAFLRLGWGRVTAGAGGRSQRPSALSLPWADFTVRMKPLNPAG